MRISIIHPSRGRASICRNVIENWLSKADEPQYIEYILSVDKDDDSDYSFTTELFLNYAQFGCIQNSNRSAIEAINRGAKIATGDIFVVVSDDFDCPENWDTLLLKHLEGKSDFLVKTQDGIQRTLITLPIMDRVYYNRFGYIYHPDYLHMESDVEMTAVGHMLGRVINVPMLFKHNHYSTGKFKKDAISEKNDSTYGQGKQVLNEHLKTNFGIANPKIQFRQIKWH